MSSSTPMTCAAAPLRILLADSDVEQRQHLHAYLLAQGYEVLLSETASEALAMFITKKPDLVLLDALLSKSDKHALIRRAHQCEYEYWVPVWLLSALVSSSASAEKAQIAALNQGADDFLLKPVSLPLLSAKLQAVQRMLVVQRRLADGQRRAKAIYDQLIDGVITISEKGLIETMNSSALKIFGYALEELQGRNISALMPEPEASAHDGYMQRYRDTGQGHIIGVGEREVQGRRKDGAVFPLELGVTELCSSGNTSFIGIVRDISERKKIQQRLFEKRKKLQHYQEDKESEHRLAHDIMFRMMRHEGLNDARVHHWVLPATNFSGDLVACVRSAQGKLYALLADATGHGLGAAISVLPVMTCLLSLTEHGFSLSRIISRLNAQLRNALPSSRFVAAAIVCVDEATGSAEIWNGGMPDVLLLNPEGVIEQRLPSRHLALGVVDFNESMDAECVATEVVPWRTDSQFVLCSDGLLEAMNAAGEAFGMQRFEKVLSETSPALRMMRVMAQLKLHVGQNPPHDDVSLMLVDCVGAPYVI